MSHADTGPPTADLPSPAVRAAHHDRPGRGR